MAKVMLIGAGGVAGVAAAKMAQNPDVFGELLIASRTKARCDAIKADIERRVSANWPGRANAHQLPATNYQLTTLPPL